MCNLGPGQLELIVIFGVMFMGIQVLCFLIWASARELRAPDHYKLSNYDRNTRHDK